MRPEDDRELCDRVLRGDDRAFALLVERHHARVFQLVRGIVGDWHQSEDVCQEVFTTLYRKVRDFRHDAQLSTWIYRVAVNAALKARKRRRGREFDALDAEALTTAQRVSAKDDGSAAPLFEGDEVFRKLLSPLPEKLRAAVVLREEGGLSYDEIARVLRCSRGAVEQRLHRAMVLLREIWKERHDWLERR